MNIGEVGRQVDQYFQTGGDSQSPSAVGAVHALSAVARADVRAVFVLKAAEGNDNARIGDVGAIGDDFVRRLRATIRSCVCSSQHRKDSEINAAANAQVYHGSLQLFRI